MECEICGRPIRGRPMRIIVEGVPLNVCSECYLRTSRSKRASKPTVVSRPLARTTTTRRRRTTTPRARIPLEELEVVPDYAERIRRARIAKGWTQAVLAQKVKESENVIKRIEAGRLIPTIDLAMRLEKVLRIKLLEYSVEEVMPRSSHDTMLTLGDIVEIRRRRK